jgi:hypothetical protein
MRTVSYSVRGAIGEYHPERGTIAELLTAIPYLLSARIIPPLAIVNDLLNGGHSDAGMSGGCEWEPFALTESEWDELTATLRSLPDDEACEFVQPPQWVESIDDWQAWIMIFKYGLPEEFRYLEREVRDLERDRAKAVESGDQERVLELHLQVIEAGNRLAEFVMAHRQEKP